MAYKVVNRVFNVNTGAFRYEFVCDSAADIANLPECCAGSVAIVADKDGPIYMVNASGEWKEQ